MTRIAPGIIQCETCGAIYPHDAGYQHWVECHAPKEKMTTMKAIRAELQQGRTR